MAPKRKGGKRHPKATQPPSSAAGASSSSSAMSSCKVPQDIIFTDILTRLPVKSILRFKCVCKPWLSLLSSPKFIAMHRERTSNNPQNHSLVIHSIDEEYYHNMSLLNINSTAKEPISLLNPFSVLFSQMDLVGCINGLVCLSCPPLGQMIILWNPAMNQSKAIQLSKFDLGSDPEKISLGFGYDPAHDDYKVVRIACLKPLGRTPKQFLRAKAEVYSANSDSWKRVEVNFPFQLSATRNNAIVKGFPYWTAIISRSKTECKFCEVLLWFDVGNEVFKHVPVPKFAMHSGTGARLVEWKGCLASLVYSPSKELENFVEVLVYDEGDGCWKKKSTHGPIGLKMERHMQCSKDGVILGETPEGKLFLYDPVTNGIKEYCIPEAQKTSYEAFSYTESLVYLKGMEEVKEQDKQKFCFNPEEAYGEDEVASYMSSLSLA